MKHQLLKINKGKQNIFFDKKSNKSLTIEIAWVGPIFGPKFNNNNNNNNKDFIFSG